MATHDGHHSVGDRFIAALRRVDPCGSYWRFSAYVSAIVVVGALGGYGSAMLLTASGANHAGAVYAGILTCLAMLFLKPTAARRPFKEIIAAGGAILIGGGVGGAIGSYPAASEVLAVAFAFAGFYTRRWPEPLPMAGLLLLMSFIVSQILAPFTPRGVIHASMIPLLVCVALGFWFLPRDIFSLALARAVQRIRAALAGEVASPLRDGAAAAASVQRIDARLRRLNTVRIQADQYDPAKAGNHLELVHWAATMARAWENAADSLVNIGVGDSTAQSELRSVCSAAETAVAAAISNPNKASREVANSALAAIDAVTDPLVLDQQADGRSRDESAATVLSFINAQLALTHLLDAVERLDATLDSHAGSRQ